MTDPIKALADAAREVLDYAKRSSIGAGDWVEATLADALAAYDAAQVSQPPSDAEIEAAIDDLMRCVATEVIDGGSGDSIAEEVSKQRLLRLMRRARPDAGLLRTEFGISSYPVPSKASDGWPDNFSVWRLKDGRTRIYRKAVAPTDAEVEGCNATELREALFNRNNDVERLVEQRDGLLRAAKAVLAVDVLMRNAQNGMPAHVFNGVLEVLQEEAIPDLRAEVARLEGA